MAKAMTTWSIPARSFWSVGRDGCHLKSCWQVVAVWVSGTYSSAYITKRPLADVARNIGTKSAHEVGRCILVQVV
jgi:hypothetical protein